MMDFEHAAARDVGVIRYRDGERTRTRYWMLNASVGVTADANLFFNHGDFLLHILKRSVTSLAILYAALRSILLGGRRDLLIERDSGDAVIIGINNLAVLKSPHVSGGLRYDVPLNPASGTFHVHCFSGAARMQVLGLLCALIWGEASALKHADGWEGSRLRLHSDSDFCVEFDGETICTREALLTIHPHRMRVAS